MINGQVLASLARNLLSSILVVAVAFALGFRSSADAAHWLGAIGLLALFVLALSWFAAMVGVTVRSPEAASGIGFLVSFLAYPSSAFVPISTMPSWLQGFARNQPVTAVIDSVRALLLGGPVAASAWPAVTWSLGITLGSAVLAGVFFRRRTI